MREWEDKSQFEVGSQQAFESGQLEELSELFDGQSRIPDDAAHCDGVYRVMARNGEEADAISHDDVGALPEDPKAGFLQSGHRTQMVDAGNLWHGGSIVRTWGTSIVSAFRF